MKELRDFRAVLLLLNLLPLTVAVAVAIIRSLG